MRPLLTFDPVGNVLPSIDLDNIVSQFRAISQEEKTSASNICTSLHNPHKTTINDIASQSRTNTDVWMNESNQHCTDHADSKRGSARAYVDKKFNWFSGQILNLKPKSGYNADGTPLPPLPPSTPRRRMGH